MARLTLKQAEKKRVTFNIENGGTALDCTSATCTFTVKKNKADAVATFSKADGDFTKASAASGVLSTVFTATNTNQYPGIYIGELKLTFASADTAIDLSEDIVVEIQENVHD